MVLRVRDISWLMKVPSDICKTNTSVSLAPGVLPRTNLRRESKYVFLERESIRVNEVFKSERELFNLDDFFSIYRLNLAKYEIDWYLFLNGYLLMFF